jgi:hypothetical protein
MYEIERALKINNKDDYYKNRLTCEYYIFTTFIWYKELVEIVFFVQGKRIIFSLPSLPSPDHSKSFPFRFQLYPALLVLSVDNFFE